MKDKSIGYILIAIVAILGLLAFDLLLVPWLLTVIVGWFGFQLTLGKAIVLVIFFNIITYGFRRKD